MRLDLAYLPTIYMVMTLMITIRLRDGICFLFRQFFADSDKGALTNEKNLQYLTSYIHVKAKVLEVSKYENYTSSPLRTFSQFTWQRCPV